MNIYLKYENIINILLENRDILKREKNGCCGDILKVFVSEQAAIISTLLDELEVLDTNEKLH